VCVNKDKCYDSDISLKVIDKILEFLDVKTVCQLSPLLAVIWHCRKKVEFLGPVFFLDLMVS
jgi:hypothetical protein